MTVAGLMDEIRKRGQRVSFILDDRTGRIEVTLFEEIYQRHRDLIVKDALVLVEGRLRFDEFSDAWRIARAQDHRPEQVREQQARRLRARLAAAASRPRCAAERRLAEILTPWRNGAVPGHRSSTGPPQASGALDLGAEWNVRPGAGAAGALEELVGRGCGMRVLHGARRPGPTGRPSLMLVATRNLLSPLVERSLRPWP